MMLDFKPLNDSWCIGPNGPGSCRYGLGFIADQVAQDIWTMRDPSADPEDVRVYGHPGADWGSETAPCGYNRRHYFGVCVASNSLYGMNCAAPLSSMQNAFVDASCRIYDAVLGA